MMSLHENSRTHTPDKLIETLNELSSTERKSRAELIRDALSDYVAKKSLPQSQAAFGLWSDLKEDGINYQTKLREEWGEK